MAEQQRTERPQRQGIISKSISVMATGIFWLLFSLVFSIVIEWVGMTFWWPDEAATHSERMLDRELAYLNTDFKRSVITTDPAQYVMDFVDFANEWLVERTGIGKGLAQLRSPPTATEDQVIAYLRQGYVQFIDYIKAAGNTTETFAVRLAVLTLALPAFVLAALVAMTEGLVRRDLRRWGGGRETSFVYHHAKRWILPSFIVSWVLYLSMPISIHPTFVVVPFALLFGIAITVTSSTFKKYL